MAMEGGTHRGVSEESFAAAANAAVKDFEDQHGVSDEPQTFDVVEMQVTASHNPIHEYIVVLRRQ